MIGAEPRPSGLTLERKHHFRTYQESKNSDVHALQKHLRPEKKNRQRRYIASWHRLLIKSSARVRLVPDFTRHNQPQAKFNYAFNNVQSTIERRDVAQPKRARQFLISNHQHTNSLTKTSATNIQLANKRSQILFHLTIASLRSFKRTLPTTVNSSTPKFH